MNIYCNKTCFLIKVSDCRWFASKNIWKIRKRDTEVYEVTSSKTSQNLLSVFGVASTGALGIKKLINDERKTGNIIVARRPYPLYHFSSSDGLGKVSIKNVSAGYGFTLFSGKCAKRGWQLFGCGINCYSQLGFQNTNIVRNNFQILMEPRVISLPSKFTKISYIGCGRAHSVIVGEVDKTTSNSQTIYLFGNNMFGQCGREIIPNEIYSNSTMMSNVNFHKIIKQVECGEMTTFLLAEDGTVYGCGSNNYGQLGTKEFHQSVSFIQICGGLENKVVTKITCRSNTVLALTEDGEVWGWGNNEYGTLFGNIDESFISTPMCLAMPDTIGKIVQVTSGNTVCAILNDQGQVYSWGMYYAGHGPSNEIVNYPRLIPPNIFGNGLNAFDQNSCKIVQVCCGIKHCVAITSSGSLFVWGEDFVLKNQNQSFPVLVPITFASRKIFIGADHTVIMGVHIM